MMHGASRFVIFSRCFRNLYNTSVRNAGHSKWQNIKHTKAAMDLQKAQIRSKIAYQIRSAVKAGGSSNPRDNSKLAKILEQAKKLNVPTATIDGIFKKIEERKDLTYSFVPICATSGCTFIVHVETDKLTHTKNMIANASKRWGKISDLSLLDSFTMQGIIITEHTGSIDKATDDAITVNANEVEEFESDETKYFKFTCDMDSLAKITNKLEGLKYNIVSVDRECIPHICVELNDTEIEEASKVKDRLLTVETVVKIDDNIA